jgi:hypothetical protein
VHEPDTTDRLIEVARALQEAASGIHSESQSTHAFAPGALLSLPAAAQRAGIAPGRPRYDDVIGELEYEGAIEWDRRAHGTPGGQALRHHPARPGRRRIGQRGAVRGPQRSNSEGKQKEDACRIGTVVRRQSDGQNGSDGGDARG